MTPRHVAIAVSFAVLAAPVLAFPGAFGALDNRLLVAIAIVAMVGATALVSRLGRLMGAVGLLAVFVLLGWLRTADQDLALSHFTGIALGLLAMGCVAAWCTSRQRLLLAAVLFLLCGTTALSVGRLSATAVHRGKALPAITRQPAPGNSGPGLDTSPLPLRGLHQRSFVNPNALAATAGMVLPLAAAVALSPARWFGMHVALRLAGSLSALFAIVILVLMQSRSAWLAVLGLLLLAARQRMTARTWWLVVGTVALGVPAALLHWAGEYPPVAEATEAMATRLAIWRDALSALWSSPWIGIGLDQYRTINIEMVHAHNIVIQTGLDVGLLGLASYLAIIAFVLRRATDLAGGAGDDWTRRVGLGAGFAVLSVHFYGLLDAVPLGAKIGIFQWLACGLVLAAWRLQGDIGYDPGRPARSKEI